MSSRTEVRGRQRPEKGVRPVGSVSAGSDGREGFALLEALVALAIVGSFAIAVIASLGAQTRAADRAVVLLTAQALAEDRRMALELLDRDALEDLPDSIAEGTFPAPFEAFTWASHAEPVDDEDDLFSTEVVVSNGPHAFLVRGMVHRSSATLVAVGAQ